MNPAVTGPYPLAAYIGAWLAVTCIPAGVWIITRAYVSTIPARRHQRATRRQGRMLTRPTITVQGDE